METAELRPLMPLIERRRGLEFREIPRLTPLSRPELVERALARLELESPRALRAQARLLEALRLVPEGFSWRSALQATLGRRLLAFYDPDQREILIDHALPPRARRRVLAHELVHALVDQHHALGARLEAAASSDARAVLLTLAEGDAEAVAGALWRSPGEPVEPLPPPGESSPPDVLTRALSAAYADGQVIVQRVLASGGFPALDALYRRPPQTTHQLLGPEPEAGPPVPPLPVPGPPEPGWTLSFSDVLGEQTWRTLLEEWLTEDQAAHVASGWHGDRLALFERGAESLLLWEVRSDAGHADAAEQAVSRGLQGALAPATQGGRATPPWCRARPGGAAMGHWRHGRSLLIASLTAGGGCERLTRWRPRLVAASEGPRDPGPAHLIGRR